jgi:uncharacterized small protein (DUF1192 family)
MSLVQAKLFELSRVNVQLYQLHVRLRRESEAGTTPDQLNRLRASICDLDARVSELLSEIERLRGAARVRRR